MSRTICFLLAALPAAVILGGCSHPRLASRPLTEQERGWAEALQRWHPGWQQPYLAPTRPGPDAPVFGGPAVPDSVWQQETTWVAPQMLPPEMFPPQIELPEPAEELVGGDDFVLVPVDAGPPAQPASPQTYEVQKGDTLTHIALKFYGTTKEWRRVWESNRKLLTAPDQLKPGMVLSIPPGE